MNPLSLPTLRTETQLRPEAAGSCLLSHGELRWTLVIEERRAWTSLSVGVLAAVSWALLGLAGPVLAPTLRSLWWAAGVTAVVAAADWLRCRWSVRRIQQRLAKKGVASVPDRSRTCRR